MTEVEQYQQALNEIAAKLLGAIGSYLGVLSNGEPALWKGTVIPPTLQVQGLQCTIEAVPQGDVVPMSAGQKFADYSWTVDLVNYSNDLSLALAKQAIEKTFTLKRKPRYRSTTNRSLETCSFSIYAPKVFNPSR